MAGNVSKPMILFKTAEMFGDVEGDVDAAAAANSDLHFTICAVKAPHARKADS